MKCCSSTLDNAICWINAFGALNIGLAALNIFDLWSWQFIVTSNLGYPLALLVGLSGAYSVGHGLWHWLK